MLITSSISGWGCSTLVPWTLELCQVCIVFLLWHICVRPSLFSSTWPEMKYRIGGKTLYSPLLYTYVYRCVNDFFFFLLIWSKTFCAKLLSFGIIYVDIRIHLRWQPLPVSERFIDKSFSQQGEVIDWLIDWWIR